MSEIVEEVKALFVERAKLWKDTEEVTNKIRDAKLRNMKLTMHLEIGSLVKDKKGIVYKVVDIEFWDTDMKPHAIKANPIKKDGSFGTATRNLWMSQDGITLVGSTPSDASGGK